MALLPLRHFEWQVLRAVKRSKKPALGRTLRLTPSRRTKDGSFLTAMVEEGLLIRVTGTSETPFDATYKLTEKGEYAAEYGECEMNLKIETAGSTKSEPSQPTSSRKR